MISKILCTLLIFSTLALASEDDYECKENSSYPNPHKFEAPEMKWSGFSSLSKENDSELYLFEDDTITENNQTRNEENTLNEINQKLKNALNEYPTGRVILRLRLSKNPTEKKQDIK